MAMLPCACFVPFVVLGLVLGADAEVVKPPAHGVFYVFGSEGITIVDPEDSRVVSTILPDVVCTKSARGKCSFGGATVLRNELIVVSDSAGNRVHLIDVEKQEVKETIATEKYPYDVYYLSWKEEVWVHTWGNATFDVISTKGKLERTHNAIKAHVKPGWTHGYMSVDEKIKDGKIAYVTHLWNPGLHQLDLDSKAYSDFVNVSSFNCSGTLHFAFSSVNNHGFFECFGPNVVLELDIDSDKVVKKWDFQGYPFASPDGRYIVSLHGPVNETTNSLLDSKVYVLEISEGSDPVLHPVINIPGGVAELVFVEKEDKEGSYFVFISLLYDDKLAVLDLDLASSSDEGKVTFIEGVGRVKTAPGMHAVGRPLAHGGDWVITPASRNSSVAVINAKSRRLHGTVPGIVGAKRLVWVAPKALPANAGGGRITHLNKALLLFLAVSSVALLNP